MTDKIVIKCPHCGKPFSQNIHEFEANVPSPSMPAAMAGFDDFIRWTALAGLGAGATAMALALSSWAHPPYWIAPVTGLGLVIGLEGLKLFLHRPFVTGRSQPGQSQVTVKAEIKTDSKHWTLLEFSDSIELSHIWFVAYRLLEQQASFSRAEICDPRYLSQPKFHEIRKTLVSLGFCVRGSNGANKYTITPSGRHFLRQVLAHPCPIPGWFNDKSPPR